MVTKEAVQTSRLSPLAAVSSSSRLSAQSDLSVSNDLSSDPADEPSDRTIEFAMDPNRFFPIGAPTDSGIIDPLVQASSAQVKVEFEPLQPQGEFAPDNSIRYFNGRPVRPARTMVMSVTAYSPDERSCGDSADGITSSNHSVWTNAMKLVAADSKVLPLGSLISVPGYDQGRVVPVLDRGGAIKGNKLDVLYPTHEIALRWGVRKLRITVWEYADGLPPCDFRAIRDSRK